jgi:regulatory protein
MKITEIKKQKTSQEGYNIFIEGEFCFSASSEDILKFSLKEGVELSKAELEHIINLCESNKAYNYALNLLSIKDYTISEIERKLLQKSFSESTIKHVINKLKEYGFVNDERYAIKYINNSLNIKKYGEKKILYNLKSKGIDDSIIRKSSIDNDVQFNNAYNLSLKKIKSLKGKTNIKEKLFRYLLSKGYTYDLTISVIEKVLKEFDDENN